MLGWICEKMTTPELTLGGGRISTSGSTTVGNGASTCNDPCVPSGDCSIVTGNSSWDNAHTSDSSIRGKRLGGSQVPWCNAHNVRVGVQEARAPPPSRFPHTILNVKRVKDNMRLIFIEKLFTNREIGTSV
jgi:hypothetical protein